MQAQAPLQPDHYYHIYSHATHNDLLFKNEENYLYFLQKYKHYVSPIAHTFAYCLMPNHFNFLIQIKPEQELLEQEAFKTKPLNELHLKLSQHISHLLNAYTQAHNKRFDRKGSLFNARFKRKLITIQDYLLHCLVYIHMNPIHHNFCTHPLEWKYNSFQNYYYNTYKAITPLPLSVTSPKELLEWHFQLSPLVELEDF